MDEISTLPKKILNFTMFKIRHDMQKICQCSNPTYTIDINNRLVTCSCGTYIDAFDVLVKIAQEPERYEREIKALLQQRQEIINYKPHMVIFRNLEQQYRKKKHGRMLPCCPHCGKAFYFEKITMWANEEFYKKEAEE